MRSNHDGIHRRDFLKQSTLAGMSLVGKRFFAKSRPLRLQRID